MANVVANFSNFLGQPHGLSLFVRPVGLRCSSCREVWAPNIDYVRLVNGDKAALRALKETKGGGHTGAMTGGMIATAIVFFPAAPVFLFMHGKDVTIPKGTEITAYVNGEIKLDQRKFQQATSAPAAVAAPGLAAVVAGSPGAAPSKPLTNADVLDLKAANFSDDLIISKIKSTIGEYSLDTKDLLELKKAGLSMLCCRR